MACQRINVILGRDEALMADFAALEVRCWERISWQECFSAIVFC